jgi:hypothetical protein
MVCDTTLSVFEECMPVAGAFLLRVFALPNETDHLDGLRAVTTKSSFSSHGRSTVVP